MKISLRILLFCSLSAFALGASELRKFDPPIVSKDGELPPLHGDQPWMRAAYSEWMPWAYTFAEWKSYRSENYLRGIDEEMFTKRAATLRGWAKEGRSVFGTVVLKEGDGRFLVVFSCFGEVITFPKTKSDIRYALGGLLMKREENGWKVVDLGKDIGLGSPVAKEFLARSFGDVLGLSESRK